MASLLHKITSYIIVFVIGTDQSSYLHLSYLLKRDKLICIPLIFVKRNALLTSLPVPEFKQVQEEIE